MNFTKLKEFLDFMSRERTPGCAVTVYYKNQKAFQYASGVSSFETGKPLEGNEFYNIYSCSKVLTVCAALTLLEQGKFEINEPLSEYIPEYRHMSVRNADGSLTEAKNPITIGDLFTMTAGLNYNLDSPSIRKARELTGGKMDTATVVRCLAEEPLSFEPGTHWQYSLCHDVLAGLVAVITGKPFRTYVKEAILDPLDMTETVYHATPEIYKNMAEQYSFVQNGSTEKTDLVHAQIYGSGNDGYFVNVGKDVSFIFGSEYDSGGAGITTTCGDYAKFLAALANNGLGLTGERILSPWTIELLKTNRLSGAPMQDYNWPALAGYGYGLGVRTHMDRAKSGSPANLGEFGWGGAAGATAIIDNEIGLGVFFTQHTLNPRENWYQPKLRNVVYGCL